MHLDGALERAVERPQLGGAAGLAPLTSAPRPAARHRPERRCAPGWCARAVAPHRDGSIVRGRDDATGSHRNATVPSERTPRQRTAPFIASRASRAHGTPAPLQRCRGRALAGRARGPGHQSAARSACAAARAAARVAQLFASAKRRPAGERAISARAPRAPCEAGRAAPPSHGARGPGRARRLAAGAAARAGAEELRAGARRRAPCMVSERHNLAYKETMKLFDRLPVDVPLNRFPLVSYVKGDDGTTAATTRARRRAAPRSEEAERGGARGRVTAERHFNHLTTDIPLAELPLLNTDALPSRIYPIGHAFENSLPNWRGHRVAGSSSSTTRRAARRACRRTATARCSRSTSRSTTAASTGGGTWFEQMGEALPTADTCAPTRRRLHGGHDHERRAVHPRRLRAAEDYRTGRALHEGCGT